ncbi:hypothetical protein [Streptomyces sp. NPDC048845]|uniref:hypothetical protein n=1 Tax=Streptomyces sp. NPDC048845 TaxID=3155390 RepID=UPI0034369CD6
MSDSANANAGPARQTGQKAKQEAAATAGEAKQAASEVRSTAAHGAKAVAGTAREQAGSAVGDLRQRAMTEADSQLRRTADTVRHWADDVAGMAEHAPSDSPARTMAQKASDGGHRAADFLERRGAGGLAEEMQSFARRKPGVFLGGAAIAGLAAGRLAKDMKSSSHGDRSAAPPETTDKPGPMLDRPGPGTDRTGPVGGRDPGRGSVPEAHEPGSPARGSDWPGVPGRPPEVT